MKLATGVFVTGSAAAILGAIVAAITVVRAYTGAPRSDTWIAVLAVLAAVAAVLSWVLADRFSAPRRLSPAARRQLTTALSRHPSAIEFDFVSGNKETTDLAHSLLQVLRDAGWAVDNHGGGPMVGRMPEGLAVVVPLGFPVPEAANVLCRELITVGFETSLVGTRDKEFANKVRLRVLPKPS